MFLFYHDENIFATKIWLWLSSKVEADIMCLILFVKIWF